MKRIGKVTMTEIAAARLTHQNAKNKLLQLLATGFEAIADKLKKGDLCMSCDELSALYRTLDVEPMDLNEATEYTGMSKSEFYKAISHGYFPAGHKIGKRRDATRVFWFRSELNEGLWTMTHLN